MGKRGPAKRPTVLTVLTGEARPSRVNYDEPKPAVGLPECPEHVSDEVREVWDYTLEQLKVMGVASPADRDAFLAYCEAVVTHRKASRLLARSDLLVPDVKGTGLVRNPVVAMQRDAAAMIRVLAREFGLTPSARSEIRMGGGKKSDEQGAERLLSG